MKTLSRKDIQRMVDTGSLSIGGKRRSSSGGGGGGGVSSTWVEDNFISKDFFNELLVIKGTKTTTVGSGQPVVEDYTFEPNEVPGTTQTTEGGVTTTVVTAITNIEVGDSSQNKGIGLWTSKFLSALGMNPSGGGGGGGASALYQLVDVKPNSSTTPTRVYGLDGTSADIGKVLMMGNDGKWYAGTVQSSGGTVTSITAGTGLSGGTITGSGTIAIDSTYQSYISHGEAAYGWGNHANVGYWESSNHPTTLSGYGITDALSNATTFWGQQVSNGVVNGAMTFSTLAMATSYSDVWSDGTNSHPWYGYDHRYTNTGVFSTTISDYYGMTLRTSQGYLSIKDNGNVGIGITNPTHNLHVAGGSLRIGDYCLISTSDGLQVIKSDNTAANLYATGGVSALGMSAGTSAVDAMTFNYVTINNELRLKNGTYTGSVFVDSNHNLCLSSLSGVIGTLGNTLYTEGGGIDTEDGDINAGGGTIITTGDVMGSRFFLDDARYLYVSNGTLYYYNGTTAKQVAFTN